MSRPSKIPSTAMIINSSRGRRYVQVVEYYNDTEGKRRRKVLESFGDENVVSIAEAIHYKANYDAMIKIINEYRHQDIKQLHTIIMILFGYILGYDTVKTVLSKVKNGDRGLEEIRIGKTLISGEGLE